MKKRIPDKELSVQKKRYIQDNISESNNNNSNTTVNRFTQPIVNMSYVNISLDGYYFIAETFDTKSSLSNRERINSKIFNGGEVSTRGVYLPREYSFESHIRVPEGKPAVYDKLFNYLMNKAVKVISPLIDDSLNCFVKIEREHVEGTKNMILVKFELREELIREQKIQQGTNNKRLSIDNVNKEIKNAG